MAEKEKHEDDYRGDADLLFPSKYIRAADLLGRDVTVTIQRVEKNAKLIKAGGQEDLKPLVHFAETDKALVLNKTNKLTIATLYGRTVADWTGKRITMFPAPFRSEQMCVRIRPVAPPKAGQKPQPQAGVDRNLEEMMNP